MRASRTIPIEIVALQLKSVEPVNLGAGPGTHYVTLGTATPSTGSMTIHFDSESGGTFSSSFEVFVDIRLGGLNGTVLFSDSIPMTSSDNEWGRIPPEDACEIEGVNINLKGDHTTDQDFWPIGVLEHDASGAAKHVVENPEPTTMLLLLGSTVPALLLRRRRKRQAG